MKAGKLRDMTSDELKLEESKLVDQIFRLRFQIAASQAENPARVHLLRKDLARVKTILREKAGPLERAEPRAAAPVAATGAPSEPAAPAAPAVATKSAQTRQSGKGRRESVAAGGGTGRSKGASKRTGAKQERG